MSGSCRLPAAGTGRKTMLGWPCRLLAVALLACVAGLVFLQERRLREEFLAETIRASRSLDPALIANLNGHPSYESLPAFRTIQSQLEQLRVEMEGRYVYLFRKGGTSEQPAAVYLAEAQDNLHDESLPSKPGDLYTEASKELMALFDGGQPFVEGPLGDSFGVRVSALVPVRNPEDGRLLAVLGVDRDAADWCWMVAERSIPLAAPLLLAILLTIAACGGHRQAASPVTRITPLLMPPLAVIILAIIGISAWLLWRQNARFLRDSLERASSIVFHDFENILRSESRGMSNTIAAILGDSDTPRLLAAGDGEALLRHWSGTFEQMRREKRLTNFNFLDSAGNMIQRIHDPARKGDKPGRFCASEAARLGQAFSGIELDTKGKLVFWTAAPVEFEGRRVGILELGNDLINILRFDHQHAGVHLVIVADKAVVGRERWEIIRRELEVPDDWDRMPDSVVIFSTLGLLPEALAPVLNHAPGGGAGHVDAPREIAAGGRQWRINLRPLNTASGERIGSIACLLDVTNAKRDFRRVALIVGLGAGTLAASLLSYVFVMLRRTDAGIARGEADLRASEEQYRLVIEHALSGISIQELVYDPAGRPVDIRILSANPAFKRHSGLDPGEVVGRLVSEVLPDLPATGLLEKCKAVVTTGQPASFEFYSRHLDRLLEISAYSIGGSRFVILFTDQTARKKAEEDLRAMNKRLEQAALVSAAADIHKNEFLGRLSHELRTPMNGILGAAQLLDNARLPAEFGESVGILKESADRMMRLITELLTFSDLRQGSLRARRREFDLRGLLRARAREVALACRAKGLTFRFRIRPGTPRLIIGDAVFLDFTLAEITKNAVEFTCRGRVELVAGLDGSALYFEVRDTGEGLPPEAFTHIFDAFWQADPSTTRKHEGVGLGLPICKYLVELMGGSITFANRPQGGAVFRVSLPLDSRQSGAASPEPAGRKAGDGDFSG
ncbi:MAG: ATP-binding protein [Terrimicrobiaceae bacterium]|nr:ATP-binding protein [Terrimicrobiaceae bacterium]